MKVGDIITVSNKVYRFIREREPIVYWDKVSISPLQVIFLGYTYKYNGEIVSDSYDSDTGYQYPRCFFKTSSVKVMVVQPYNKYNHYRKHFYSLLEIL